MIFDPDVRARVRAARRAEQLATYPAAPRCDHCGLPIFQVFGEWHHLDLDTTFGLHYRRGCRAASFISSIGWDDSIDRKRQAKRSREDKQ